jgi:hypothetical protein
MAACSLCKKLQKSPPENVVTTHAELEASELLGCDLCTLLRKVSSIVHRETIWRHAEASDEVTYVEIRPPAKIGYQNVANLELFRKNARSKYSKYEPCDICHYDFYLLTVMTPPDMMTFSSTSLSMLSV